MRRSWTFEGELNKNGIRLKIETTYGTLSPEHHNHRTLHNTTHWVIDEKAHRRRHYKTSLAAISPKRWLIPWQLVQFMLKSSFYGDLRAFEKCVHIALRFNGHEYLWWQLFGTESTRDIFSIEFWEFELLAGLPRGSCVVIPSFRPPSHSVKKIQILSSLFIFKNC